MNYSLIIQSAPFESTAAMRALQTAKALIAKEHKIHRLFFYQNGVFNADSRQVPPQQLTPVSDEWQQLIQAHQLDAVICVSSALQRGVMDDSEAQRYDKGTGNMLAGFTLGGLGLLVEALSESDRVLTFG